MPRPSSLAASAVAAWVCLSVPSCSTDYDSLRRENSAIPPAAKSDEDAAAAERPFEPVAPFSYVAKVKNLLTGLPVTSDELALVSADPEALKGLVASWLALPEAHAKLLDFFANAFQQSQFLTSDLEGILGSTLPGQGTYRNALVANLKESFARTALDIVLSGRPLTETMTTRTFMMTPAMMSLLALVDTRRYSDSGGLNDKWYDGTAKQNPIRIQNTTVVPLDQSLNAASPNYMVFHTPGTLGTDCAERVYPAARENSLVLAKLLFGVADPTPGTTQGAPCSTAQTLETPVVTAADFTTWKKVTVRKPNVGENITPFWALPKLRGASELVLDIPRVGFFSTLAFQANWRTNSSNLARVTTNQTLIVALGASFSPDALTVPVSEVGLDAEHADPTTACYGCHKQLDPMRLFFRRSFSLSYHEQLDPKVTAEAPSFSFGGVNAAGSSLSDLAITLASHPRFPIAWAQKLCFYANSTACSEDDPELARVASTFKESNFDFTVLVRELFASPLVTGAARTATFENQEHVVSVARYDHLCHALGNRLGVDACAISAPARLVAGNLPRDGYNRGGEFPVLTSDVSLFYRAGVENLCRAVADAVVDAPAPAKTKYTSGDSGSAITDFTHTVMGLAEGDPRAAGARAILQEHHDAAAKTGAKPVDALKSTFVLACTAPSAVSIGL